MKRYIFKILFFLFPILLIFLLMEISIRKIPNDYMLKENYLELFSNDIETLILGSSHSYRGINPANFDSIAFNAAMVSQTLDFDYEIFKKFQYNFKKLKTIILPVSYFSFFCKLESGAEFWRIKNYVIYYRLNCARAYTDYFEALSSPLRTNLDRLKSYFIFKNENVTCTNLGWGMRSIQRSLISLEETGKVSARRHTINDSRDFLSLSEMVRLIIESCNQMNVRVILLTLPAHHSYRVNLNSEQLRKTIATAKKLSETYQNCFYINLLDDNAFTDEFFYDADHLNSSGSNKLSLLINEFILKQN